MFAITTHVDDDVCTAKYKTLEKLLSTTELPALVEQKPRSHADQVDVFEPLTLTEKFEQTFLVVNFINDGKSSLYFCRSRFFRVRR